MESISGITFPQEGLQIGQLVGFGLLGYIVGLLIPFATAGILYVWLLLWGGEADYVKTYQLYIYATTPTLVFGWLPFI
ncbi:MAG: hypothetical protein IH852_17065 [Bacteroidetes bacterium]|nr:hypothetical protein [Bacteroidota bacterium]